MSADSDNRGRKIAIARAHNDVARMSHRCKNVTLDWLRLIGGNMKTIVPRARAFHAGTGTRGVPSTSEGNSFGAKKLDGANGREALSVISRYLLQSWNEPMMRVW